MPPGRELPDPCDVASLQASQLRWDEAASPEGLARSRLVQARAAGTAAMAPAAGGSLQEAGHTAERVDAQALRVQWRYGGGTRIQLEINLGSAPASVQPAGQAQADEAVRAQDIFAYRRSSGDQAAWPAWSARWTLIPAP